MSIMLTTMRINNAIVYTEIALVILIITLYALWAYHWSNIGETISLAFDHSSTGMVAVWILGGIFWGIIFLVLLEGNIRLRYYHAGIFDDPYKFAALAALHPLYHIIRWPIFAVMVTSAVIMSTAPIAPTTPIAPPDYSSGLIIVNESLITFAMWLESAILGFALMLFAIMSLARFFCRK